MPAAKTVQVLVVGDSRSAQAALRQLNAAAGTTGGGLTKLSTRLKSIGGKLTSAGKTLTRNLTFPIVAGGIAAGKLAVDYDSAFTKISAVSNASVEDVEKWRESVKGLAEATARDPRELADALFFLASAGLKANQIMPTLEASAKAAASGLGETQDVAKLTANALNAYAGTGLEAAKVTDILVAAVREGSADTDEFAGAMGRILPIASKAGVTFDQVAASLATVSNIGLDVDEGVTAMRGLLQALVAPGSAAAAALKKVGISADEMREIIREKGLLAALRELEEATDGDIDAIREIVPNVRALTGAFGLTVQEAEKVDEIFERVRHSTGSMREAFKETREGEAFKFQQGLAKLKVAAIELGERLIPIGLRIVGVVGRITDWFTRLSPATQDFIVKVALLSAALGPTLRLLGGITKGIGGLIGMFGSLTGATTASTAALGPWAAAVALAGLLAVKLSGNGVELGEVLGSKLTRALTDNGQGFEGVLAVAGKLDDKYRAMGGSVAEFAGTIAGATDATQKQREQIANSLRVLDQFGVELSDSARFTIDAYIATGNYELALRTLRRYIDEVTGDLVQGSRAADRWAESMHDAVVETKNLRAEAQNGIPNPVGGGNGNGKGGGKGDGKGGNRSSDRSVGRSVARTTAGLLERAVGQMVDDRLEWHDRNGRRGRNG